MRDDSSNDSGENSPEKSAPSLRMRAVLGGAALGVLAAFAGGIWYAYVNADDARFQSPPLIEAPEAPVKVRPENPGGLQVPDRDKLVLKSLEGEDEPKVEKLLPPPERPLEENADAPAAGTGERPPRQNDDVIGSKIAELERQGGTAAAGGQSAGAGDEGGTPAGAAPDKRPASAAALEAAGEKTAETVKKQAKAATAAIPPVAAPEPAMPEPPKLRTDGTAATKPAAVKAAGVATETAETPSAAAKPAPAQEKTDRQQAKQKQPEKKLAEKKPQKAVVPGKFRVQLGAFKTADIAEEGWRRLSKKFPAILGKQPHYVIAVTLGSRGVFHRLQFGAFDDRDQAKSVCARLKAKKQDCLVVAP